MNVLIFGASSWVGYHVIDAVLMCHESWKCLGVYRSHPVIQNIPSVALDPVDLKKLEEMFFSFHPTVVVNLLRGETATDLLFHQRLIALCTQLKSFYIYASSANAVDAILTRDHLESDSADAQSDYGKFKAQCEADLVASDCDYAVVRFCAIHGWAPGRKSRTEEFLENLQKGQTILQPRGIIQNRLSDRALAQMIVCIAETKSFGIHHLGARDSSDEVDFRRNLAAAFGYDPALIVEDGKIVCNLTLVPGKIGARLPTQSLPSEADSIRDVSAMVELQRYKRG